jgi:Protein of unknown function (DUF3298).
MTNRLAPARPIISLTAFAFLYMASATLPAASQPEAQAAAISKNAKMDAGCTQPDRSLYIKPRTDPKPTPDLLNQSLTFNFTRLALPDLELMDDGEAKVQKNDIKRNDQAARKTTPSLATVSVHRRKQHEGYLVDVTYPQFRGDSEPVIGELNRKAKAVVNANIPNKPGDLGGINYEYTCSYENQLVSPYLVSSRFEFYKDTGGAYGASMLVPFNYELKDKVKELKLADLLGKPVDYDWLASIAFTALQQEYGEDLYDEPDELLLKDQDFSKFTFDANGITFFFNQGDITPYAVGCPSVTLTYVELQPILSPKSPVYKYLNPSNGRQAHPQPMRANCAS